jgi:transposase
MRSLVGELEYIGAEKLKLEQKLKDLSGSERYKSNVKLLLSVPSIGLLTAMVLLTELGDIKRFKRFDELCSYCGLSPNCHSSGEVEQVGGMSRRGNSFVKLVLIEYAWVAVRKDPALLLYYKDQLKVMKGAKAIIKVTRKLLSRIKYVLENKVEYEIGLVK